MKPNQEVDFSRLSPRWRIPRLNRRSWLRGAAAFSVAGVWGCARGGQKGGAGWPQPRFVRTNGIRLAVYHQGKGLPIVFSHGFPELAFSWRHQLAGLSGAGIHAIAPDQRGYGLTDRPPAIEAYTLRQICADLAGLLDALRIKRAIFCGHDWGGAVVWMMPLRYPERVAGVIGLNTPFGPRPPVAPLARLRQAFGERHYIVAFQEPGVAEAALGRDVRKTFTLLMRRGGLMDAEAFARLPPESPERRFDLLALLERDEFPGEMFLSAAELDYFVETYERTGFAGGVNWYRNIDRNWEESAGLEYRINVPCLMISAEDDVVLPPSAADGMERLIPDLEKRVIPDCGHWTQQEKPDEVNRLILEWVRRRFPKGVA